MSHLLGGKSCLESLARDIEDIQNTINDCTGRVNVDNIQSWKFPDKLSNELDIEDLLKTYSYSNDPDFDRLAHIVLFELVIDRFVFLVQIVAQFLDIAFDVPERGLASKKKMQSSLTVSSMSIGLAVKKFWNKAVHVSHIINKFQQKAKGKASLIPKMSDTISSLQEDNDVMRDVLLSMHGRNSVLEERTRSSMTIQSSNSSVNNTGASSAARIATGAIEEIIVSIEDVAISKIMSNAATQTFDTAFVACEACAHMQQNLIDVGTAVISLCESQGLQSSLAKQKKLLKKSLMAATDVNRWATEQNRDIDRINKHLEYLYSEIEPLKSELEKSRQTSRKLRDQLKDLKNGKEGAEMEFIQKEKELDMRIQTMSAEQERKENSLKEELVELKAGKEVVEGRLATLDEENKGRKELNHHLETENARITASLEEEKSEKERLKEFEKEFRVIEKELVVVRKKLHETEVELDKAQTENQALTKRGKMIQAKQEMLLQRADQLDQECEELQNKLIEMEDERERLLSENESLKSKNESEEIMSADLKAIIDETAKEKAALENRVKTLHEKVAQLELEIADAMKQITLLSEFPVFSHVEGGSWKFTKSVVLEKSDCSTRGEEMGKQVKANNIRIAVLEDQNNSLRDALARNEQFISDVPSDIPTDRVPLWETGQLTQWDSEEYRKIKPKPLKNAANETCSSKSFPDWSQNHHRVAPDRKASGSPSPKPPSQPQTVTSKLNKKRQAYTSGVQKSHGNGTFANRSDAPIFAKGEKAAVNQVEYDNVRKLDDDYSLTNVYSCPDCDKMYTNQRDLQIHKSFCYANV